MGWRLFEKVVEAFLGRLVGDAFQGRACNPQPIQNRHLLKKPPVTAEEIVVMVALGAFAHRKFVDPDDQQFGLCTTRSK